ncbi:MAG: fucose 4-O-acetylase-like acetyltransferase [Polaribacter sp.]|jgi:fucose 4-O-acetylase-like acetyltransferase
MPKQERIAAQLKLQAKGRLIIICGGPILDFQAGRVKRAPTIFRKLGMEWLYRLACEPKNCLFDMSLGSESCFLINIQQIIGFNKMHKNRDVAVDTLRGLACILLVSYHVIGSNYTNGLRISEGMYRDLNDIFVFIRMPLFTFLSGYIYTNRPFSGNIAIYVNGKTKRLLIPMLVVGTIFALLQSFVPGSNNSIQNWYLLHILPVAHFWFIESIFLCFIVLIPLEKYKLLSNKIKFSIVFLVSAFLYISNIDIPYFSISGFIYLFPYFLLGLAVNRFSLVSYVNGATKIFISCLILGTLFAIYNDSIGVESTRATLPLIIGCLSCCVLLAYKFESNLLAKIGVYSYSIYLFHVFFTAGTRIFLSKLGIIDTYILFSFSLISGVLGAIAIENVFNKYYVTRILMLGKKGKIS